MLGGGRRDQDLKEQGDRSLNTLAWSPQPGSALKEGIAAMVTTTNFLLQGADSGLQGVRFLSSSL